MSTSREPSSFPPPVGEFGTDKEREDFLRGCVAGQGIILTRLIQTMKDHGIGSEETFLLGAYPQNLEEYLSVPFMAGLQRTINQLNK